MPGARLAGRQRPAGSRAVRRATRVTVVLVAVGAFGTGEV